MPVVAASLATALAATPALAQGGSAPEAATGAVTTPTEALLNDRFVIALGEFVVTSNINGSLSGSANTTEQNTDFSKDFGTDASQSRFRADVLWRITPRQQLQFSYFDNAVQHTRTLDRDLAWGDYTFLAGGQVTAETKFRVYELDYGFAFLRRRDYEVVVLAGIHLDDVTLKLSGNASLTVDTPTGPVEQTATFTTKSNSVPAPLPTLGLRAAWAATPRLYVNAEAQVFAISYQGINGNWSELRAGATWMFSHHFGVGLGYDRFATHVDLEKAGFTGRLNFGYQGLLLYVKGGF
jgi:hypothetical protein